MLAFRDNNSFSGLRAVEIVLGKNNYFDSILMCNHIPPTMIINTLIGRQIGV